MCNHDCLNCIHPDCDNDIVQTKTDYSLKMNASWCKNWYQKNAEKKRAYQREYARRKRAEAKGVLICN